MTVTAAEALHLDVRLIARDIAAPHAAEVDAAARFPSEAVDALREAKAMSALVPRELGGGGALLRDVAMACFELAQHCGASAMVFAMHQIQVATLARHGCGRPWFESYLESVAREQRLIASVTSEIGTGGDMGRSIAAVTPGTNGTCRFEKRAPTVSYGAYADDLLTTLRRGPDAEPNDQVLALTTRSQAHLDQQGTWDPLGMRGTCSPPYIIRAEFPVTQVLDAPFAAVASESMVPLSHLLWSHVWLGIATAAFGRARASVRASARQHPGEVPPSARRLSALQSDLTMLRAEVSSALQHHTESTAEERRTMAAALRINSLKVAASEQAARVCLGALNVCGFAGYLNDTPFSVGRHLRDVLSAPLMVSNDRIHDINAGLLLIAKET